MVSDTQRPIGFKLSGICIADQGMMGGVNGAYDYYHSTMRFGIEDPKTHEPIVQDALLQGGIVGLR